MWLNHKEGAYIKKENLDLGKPYVFLTHSALCGYQPATAAVSILPGTFCDFSQTSRKGAKPLSRQANLEWSLKNKMDFILLPQSLQWYARQHYYSNLEIQSQTCSGTHCAHEIPMYFHCPTTAGLIE